MCALNSERLFCTKKLVLNVGFQAFWIIVFYVYLTFILIFIFILLIYLLVYSENLDFSKKNTFEEEVISFMY